MSAELTLEQAALAWAQGKRVEAMPVKGGCWKPIDKIGECDQEKFSQSVFGFRDAFEFRLAPEPPAVGTAEWANSLPEGTRVRHKNWERNRWASRSGGVNWFENTGWNCGHLVAETGWELYTEPPAKKFQPWTPEEVPVGALTKPKSGGDVLMIIGRFSTGALLAGDRVLYPLGDLLKLREHSIDGGKTWLPCGVEVDA